MTRTLAARPSDAMARRIVAFGLLVLGGALWWTSSRINAPTRAGALVLFAVVPALIGRRWGPQLGRGGFGDNPVVVVIAVVLIAFASATHIGQSPASLGAIMIFFSFVLGCAIKPPSL
jgi:hypothetical protein